MRQAVPQQLIHVLLATPSSSVPLTCTADSTSKRRPMGALHGALDVIAVQLQLDTTVSPWRCPPPTQALRHPVPLKPACDELQSRVESCQRH